MIGGLATQSVHGFVGGVLWGGFARIFALDHATWAVNSLGHTIGNREFDSATTAATSARWRRRPWVGHGTTTTTHDPPWHRPADTGGNSTRPGSSSGSSTPSDWSTTCGTPIHAEVSEVKHDSRNTSPTTASAARRIPRQGDRQLNPKSARAKRVVALVTIGIPAIGFAIALYLVFTGRATALDYWLFGVFYAIQMFGITLGFHRYARTSRSRRHGSSRAC